jgi:hypothetical protein
MVTGEEVKSFHHRGHRGHIGHRGENCEPMSVDLFDALH